MTERLVDLMVTRDRASAYAKAVEEILPDCMQVADSFHLHQNLLEAINKVLNREIPATTAVESKNKECVSCNENKSTSKKIVPIVDNLTTTEEKRLQLIKQIPKLHHSGVSIREITKQLQINRHTVRKYLNGKPEILCRSNKRSSLDKYKSFIIECLQSGNTQMETVRKISEQGCSCSMSNIRQYIYNVIKQYQIDVKKYVSSSSDVKCKKSNGKIEHITRKGIFQYL